MKKSKFVSYSLIALMLMVSLFSPAGRVSANTDENLSVAPMSATMEDGRYNVKVGLYNASSPDRLSMAAEVMNEDAVLIVENGSAKLELKFQTAIIYGMSANLDKLNYYPNQAASNDVANSLETEIVSTYDVAGVQKPEVIRFDVPQLGVSDIYVHAFYMGSPSGAVAIVRVNYDESVKIVDRSSLETKINEAKALMSARSLDAAYHDLQTAIDTAQAVYDNMSATQAEVNAQVNILDSAIVAFKIATTPAVEEEGIKDGKYEVPVALWHATANKESMAGQSFNNVARIVVKNGKARMYVYTRQMSFGTIVASLQEMKVLNVHSTYSNATVETRDAQGNPTSFSFDLPHMNEYINVKVNPHVAMMGNQDIDARIKVDYTQMKAISNDVDEKVAPVNVRGSVATSDSTNTSMIITIAMLSATIMVAITLKKRVYEK